MFEIGNSLREARLRQQLDFLQAEQATKIRGKYLRALEEEQFDVLPSQTYVKGFLRNYAEYLGLDGQLYVDEYNGSAWLGFAKLGQTVIGTPNCANLTTGVVLCTVVGVNNKVSSIVGP